MDALEKERIGRIVREIIDEWIGNTDIMSPCDINKGLCYEFAEELAARIASETRFEAKVRFSEEYWKKDLQSHQYDAFVADVALIRSTKIWLPDFIGDYELSLLLGGATHAWVECEGLHYDATTPQGVNHFTRLKFYQDQFLQIKASKHGQYSTAGAD
jgi:hypothetical protein